MENFAFCHVSLINIIHPNLPNPRKKPTNTLTITLPYRGVSLANPRNVCWVLPMSHLVWLWQLIWPIIMDVTLGLDTEAHVIIWLKATLAKWLTRASERTIMKSKSAAGCCDAFTSSNVTEGARVRQCKGWASGAVSLWRCVWWRWDRHRS